MILDFKDLKKIVKDNVIDKLDHVDLNTLYENPTAEIMVVDIAQSIMQKLPKDIYLESVKLWETEDSYAEYRPNYESLGSILKPAT